MEAQVQKLGNSWHSVENIATSDQQQMVKAYL
jgi:hypothetical protein